MHIITIVEILFTDGLSVPWAIDAIIPTLITGDLNAHLQAWSPTRCPLAPRRGHFAWGRMGTQPTYPPGQHARRNNPSRPTTKGDLARPHGTTRVTISALDLLRPHGRSAGSDQDCGDLSWHILGASTLANLRLQRTSAHRAPSTPRQRWGSEPRAKAASCALLFVATPSGKPGPGRLHSQPISTRPHGQSSESDLAPGHSKASRRYNVTLCRW